MVSRSNPKFDNIYHIVRHKQKLRMPPNNLNFVHMDIIQDREEKIAACRREEVKVRIETDLSVYCIN